MSKTEFLKKMADAKSAETKAKTFSLKIDQTILDEITTNEYYKHTIVSTIGEFLAIKYQLDYKNQFLVMRDVDQLDNFLKISRDFHKKPLFIVYNIAGNYWVALCISASAEGAINVFYKDPCCKAMPDDLKNAILRKFSPTLVDLVEFRSYCRNTTIFDINGPDSGPRSLKTLEIMMKNINDDKDALIKNFDNLFSEEKEVGCIKTDLKVDLAKPRIDKMLEGFEPDIPSKEELKKFIAFAVITKERFQSSVGDYEKILKTELGKQKPDFEAIMKAQNNLKDKVMGFDGDIEKIRARIKEVFPEYRFGETQSDPSNSSSSCEKNDNESNEDEQNKQPNLDTPLKKFTFISSLLRGTQETDKLNSLQNDIAIKFGLEASVLKEFFKVDISKEETKAEEITVKKPTPLSASALSKLLSMQKQKPAPSTEEEVGKIKCLEQLLAEVALGRDIKEDTISMYSPDELEVYFKEKYSTNTKVLELEKTFHEVKTYTEAWKEKDIFAIRQWAEEKKISKLTRNYKDPSISETIAIMDRVLELTTKEGHRLRKPQILSVIEFLSTGENEGKLCQISTGEGKTYIIAVVASIKVLQGYVVDVHTSSIVLATAGVESTRYFYNAVGITVMTNNITEAEAGRELKPRPCYKADIVYGTISNFEFDYLRDTFEGHKTLAERPFGYGILDEVDNLAIDNGSYIAKLAGPFPGMESLKYVYIKIWQELFKAETSVFKEYEQEVKLKSEELKKLVDAKELSEESSQNKFEDFKVQLLHKKIDSIKPRIIASNPTNIKFIPPHLKEYCKSMLEEWVDNALYGKYYCHEKENYVIKDKDGEGRIIPVDYQNTGVTLKNTIWCKGQHQYLQLKHNLELTAESLTSSFISNIGFIKLYNNRILGLTGTLGSEAEKGLLSTAYNLSFSTIPRYKPRLFTEFEGLVVRDDHLLNLVSIEAFILACKGRSVQIVCKTIKDVQEIEKYIKTLLVLEGKLDKIQIKTFVDECDSEVMSKPIDTSEIIITTTIAGRGVDFKTTAELQKNGGMHVMAASLSYNKRVQDQLFGRTARQGEQGTGQLILPESDIIELGLQINTDEGSKDVLTMAKILAKRDELERERLEQIKNEKLAEIDFQDILFSKFSRLYSDFKKKQLKKLGGLFVAEDLKEFWAFWLHKRDFKGKLLSEIDQEFNQFKQDAKDILGSEGVEPQIKCNPYYSVRQAEYFIKNSKIAEAEKCLEHAISLSGDFAPYMYSAYLMQFEIAVEKGGQLRERFRKAVAEVFFISVEKDVTYKKNAKEALEKAIIALDAEIEYLESNFIGKESEDFKGNDDFKNILINQEGNILVKHIQARFVALSTYRRNANSCLEQLNESSTDDTKGIAISSKIPYLKELDEKDPTEKQIKASLTDSSISELESVGLETIYALREVHDGSKDVIDLAKIQIGGGLAALATGLSFPVILPVMGPIAGILISEGFCDIIMELLSSGDTGFDVKSYVKGKCINVGIALATWGLGAIATSNKILKHAEKACKSLAARLRHCPKLRAVCEKLATKLDKLATHFAKRAVELRKLQKLSMGVSRVHLVKSAMVNIGKQTLQSTLGSIISEKIVTAGLTEILQGLKPEIEKQVRKAIENDQGVTQKIKSMDSNNFGKVLRDILMGTYGEMAGDVLQEIAFGVLRHSKNWKLKIASLALDSGISISKISLYANQFCEKLKHVQITNGNDDNNEETVGQMRELTITQVSEHIFMQLIQLSGKYANTFVVSPIMNKLCGRRRQGPSKEDDSHESSNLAEISDAYETLGLKPDASLDEVKQAYTKQAKKHHPDRPGGSHDQMVKINKSYEYIKNLHKEASSGGYSQSTRSGTRTKLIGGGAPSETGHASGDTNEQAHRGNISTISKKMEQHIIVQCEINAVTKLKEFGSKYKNNGKESLIIIYNPPTAGRKGHFTIPAEIDAKLKLKGIQVSFQPTAENNCLYEALAPQINAQNLSSPISANQLRELAEKFSLANLSSKALLKASNLLNNPITKYLHIKAKGALLVGGSLDSARDFRNNFVDQLKSLKLAPPEKTLVTLTQIMDVVTHDKHNIKKAMEKIMEHSPNFDVSKPIEVYTIQNLANLGSLLINHEYPNRIEPKRMPMAVELPNGMTVIFAADLYALGVIDRNAKAGKPDLYIANTQYNGKGLKGLGSAFSSLKALTDNFSMGIELMAEIAARLIGESIRNKSNFVTLCLALIKDSSSPLCGHDPSQWPLAAMSSTGVDWDESPSLDIKNPDYLLDRHLESCKYIEKLKKIVKNPKELYENIFKLVSHIMGQGENPFPEDF